MRKQLMSALLVATLPMVALTATPAAAASGEIDVLTYNIAGLPEGLSSAPTPRAPATTAIGQRLGPYTIVNVQEDFNYHANLYAADAHPYRTPTSGGAGIGSGLNTLSSLPFDNADLERVTWDDCNLNEADCLTPKGFTFLRVSLAEGAWLDVYNLHADAGSTSDDISVRARNFAQLTSFIQSHSVGSAVLVMGDTNARYTRAGDDTTLRSFVAANGLTDTRPALAPETVDKIFYRSSRLVTLTASGYDNEHDRFLDDAGRMLSDHDPIVTRLAWAQNPDFQASDAFGGPHGSYFNDIDSVPADTRAIAISLRTGSRVDQVGITLAGGTTLTHGGTGGAASALTLADGEYLTSAYLCRAQHDGRTRIFYARFTTNLGRTLAGGSTTGDCTTMTAPAGWQIAGFHGRSGAELDRLGVIFTQA